MLRLPRQQQTCKQPLSLSLPAPTSLNRPRTTLPEAGYTDKAPSLALRSRSEKFSITLEANYLETSQSTTCQLEDLLIFSWSPFELFDAFFHRDQTSPRSAASVRAPTWLHCDLNRSSCIPSRANSSDQRQQRLDAMRKKDSRMNAILLAKKDAL